ncbi:MAG: cyclic nucleotide-binding domain-containing protein [Spirochaetaceae bacterium]|jgi:CRP-like cAMP-binding protein|nr:cyclic nucleotide-binding domain-containing protein [Spirochaetaceae bacterium]
MESSALQKYSLFGGLLTDQIEGILPLLEEEVYEEGEEIIVEGTPNDKIRFILEGRVVVVKLGTVLCTFGEGDAFGEMEVLDVMPSAATIKALTHLRVMAISNKALREIYKLDLKTFALLIMNLARALSRRLRHMDDRIKNREFDDL